MRSRTAVGVSIGLVLVVTLAATIGLRAQSAPAAPAAGQGSLILYGDLSLFYPPPHADNCILKSRYKRGEPVGFRMFVADPATGKREESAQLVVHLSVGGKTIDIPMRYRATATQPEREFWVAKWVVPQDAAPGIIRYTVTATDKYGRTGTFKPFDVQASQLTIAE